MKNLEAEMKRYGVTLGDIQHLLKCSEKTVRNKVSGRTDFTRPEAFKVHAAYFKSVRFEYLFSEDRPDDRRNSA